MQMQPSQGLSLADVPMGFFPEDILDVQAMTRSAPMPAPFANAAPAKVTGSVQSRALKLSRAKTGESELRLLAEQDGNAVRYSIASSTIAPYSVKREVLVKTGKKKNPMNEQQAVEEFERRVALAYPPEKLRNNKTVPIHLNLI